jgi:hypothetical protein
MHLDRQEKFTVLLIWRGALGHAKHMLLTGTINIGVEQTHRQSLLRECSSQIVRDS